MAYSKTTWEDLPSTNTPITASNLNNIENQVDTNTDDIADLTSDVATNTSDISTLSSQVSTNTSNIATNTSNLTPVTQTNWYANTNYVSGTGATKVYKIGRIVIVNVNLNITTLPTTNDTLLYGLPIPYLDNVTGAITASGSTGTRVRILTSSGSLTTDGVPTQTGWYNGTITYVSAS